MEGLRQVFLDFTSFGAGQSGSSEMDSAKFVKLAKVRRLMCRRDIHTSIIVQSWIVQAQRIVCVGCPFSETPTRNLHRRSRKGCCDSYSRQRFWW